MKICDRCYHLGDYKLGVKEITTTTHESFDLCETCFQLFINFMSPKKEVKNDKNRNSNTVGKTKKKKA